MCVCARVCVLYDFNSICVNSLMAVAVTIERERGETRLDSFCAHINQVNDKKKSCHKQNKKSTHTHRRTIVLILIPIELWRDLEVFPSKLICYVGFN